MKQGNVKITVPNLDRLFEKRSGIYEELEPELRRILFYRTIYDATSNFFSLIEDSKVKGITWARAEAVLRFHQSEINWENLSPDSWDNLTPDSFTLSKEDLDIGRNFEHLPTSGLYRAKEIILFRILTRNLINIHKDGQLFFLAKGETENELRKLPPTEQEEALFKIGRPVPFEIQFKAEVKNRKNKKEKVKGRLKFLFNNLLISFDEGFGMERGREEIAYYPLTVSLRFLGIETPPDLPKKERESLYEGLLYAIEEKGIKAKIPTADIVPAYVGPPTFAVPSTELMSMLLDLFSGMPSKIPKKFTEKDVSLLESEQEKLNELLKNLGKPEGGYDDSGKPVKESSVIALVCDSPMVKAKAKISEDLFKEDVDIAERKLAVYLHKTFGPEGLRHLLSILIGLERNHRQGFFLWDQNKHLENMGYRKKKGGSFKEELRRTSSDIVKILADITLTMEKKRGQHRIEQGLSLFSIDGYEREKYAGKMLSEKLVMRATDVWYGSAFRPPRGQSIQYTKLLQQLARVSHVNNPLTLYLGVRLAIRWRFNPVQEVTIKTLMTWCSLDPSTKNPKRTDHLRKLEAELTFMQDKGHLGEWKNIGYRGTKGGIDGFIKEDPFPSKCKESFECKLRLTAPDWFKKELEQIGTKRERLSLGYEPVGERITRDEFITIRKNHGLNQTNFGSMLGITQQMVSAIEKGTKKVPHNVSRKIRERFGDEV